MQRKHVQSACARFGHLKHRLGDVRFADPVSAQEFVKGRQRRRQLWTGAAPAGKARPKGRLTAGIAGKLESKFPLELQRASIDLPARGRVRLRIKAKHLLEGIHTALEFDP